MATRRFPPPWSLDPNQIQILWPWILFLFLASDPTWDLDSPRVIG